MKNILFIESGQYGGGSFNALNIMIKNMKNINPIIIYFNQNKFIKNSIDNNIKCYLLKDIVYSLNSNTFFRKLLNRVNLIISKFFPFASIEFEKFIHSNTIKSINKIIDENNINIIHTNISVSRDFFLIFCLQKNIKLIGHLRSPKNELLNYYKSQLINKRYHKIIAASESIKKHWVSSGINKNKIVTIYDGIELKSIKSKNINQIISKNIGQNSFIIGCVSRFAKGKGQSDLIYAFYNLLKQNKLAVNFQLVFFGDGELEQKCKLLVKKLNISEFVSFFGYIDDAPSYLCSLDLMILPSSIDVCSNAILEAFLTKVPVIALNKGGNPELIINNINGFTYDKESQLINNINLIIKEKQNSIKFINKSYSFLNQKFNVEKNTLEVNKIYNS